jgi:hypothetical protein
MDDGTNRAMFNQITYNNPIVPPVFSALTLGPNATEESAYGPLSFVVDHMQPFELLVKNGDAGKHPLFVISSWVPHRLLIHSQPSSRPQVPGRPAYRQLLVREPKREPSVNGRTGEPCPP